MTLYPTGPRPSKRVKAPRPLRRSKRPRKVRKTTAGQKARTADRLFSLIVRANGPCRYHYAIAANVNNLGCIGPLQCAHIVSRRYRSVRWDEKNAMPLCAGAHMKFTHDPLLWEEFVIRSGCDLSALKVRALEAWSKEIDGVLVRLAARAVALGLPVEKGKR